MPPGLVGVLFWSLFWGLASGLFPGLVPALSAQVDSPVPRPTGAPTRSRSGQFLVLGDLAAPATGGSQAIRLPTGPSQRSVTLNPLRPMDQGGVATLNPPVLSVACERVKAGVLRVLRLEDHHRGSVVVRILKADSRRLPARIVATQYTDGWRYALELQERLDSTLLVRSLVEVLLLEIANRENEGSLSPIPLWLSEGITTLLMVAESGPELVPQMDRDFKDPRRPLDPVAAIAGRTAGRAPLGFETLAQPPEALLGDTNRFAWFQGSSALLVHQLRSLGGNSGSLGRLVVSFNRPLNWQTGFLRTYSAEFSSLLDVEKWWGVVSMAFHVQDAARRMTPEAWTGQMRSVLTETVEVAATTNGVPERRRVRISQILEEWPYPAQQPVLQRKLFQLRMLLGLGESMARRDGLDESTRARLVLLDRFIDGLTRYQEARLDRSAEADRRGAPDPRVRLLVSSTADRLKAIEQDLLSPAQVPPAPSPTGP